MGGYGMIMMLWIVLCMRGVRGRIRVDWHKGFNATYELVSDTPVPFNSNYLNENISAVVLDNYRVQRISNFSDLDYILLCNITVYDSYLVHDCDAEVIKHAKLVINLPPYFTKEPGRTYFYFRYPPPLPPVIELKLSEYVKLTSTILRTNWTLNISVTPSNYNIWIEIVNSPQFIFGQVVVTLVSLMSAVGALYCLVLLRKDRFPQLSHVILLLELFNNIQRALYFAIDPLLTRRIITFSSSLILETISLPFSLSASLLIGVFWYGLVHQKNLHRLHNEALFVPTKMMVICSMVVMFICCCEIAFAIYYIASPLGIWNRVLTPVRLAIYSATTLGIFIFYIYTGFLLVKTLKMFNAENPLIRKIQKLLYLLIFVMMLLLLVYVFELSPVYETANGFFSLWFLGHFSFALQGVVHVIAFMPRKNPPKPLPPNQPIPIQFVSPVTPVPP
eukprot:TRINITY_DN2928_c0_g1_i3.p1 TRINITY_DN2928_c0_g1~~TRINITY_DN2928_c0_g1_i3.p1  ORF type:complete len:461 (+),score=82.92 TRINITY_DN2928_c0_g1_i3:43-1383(+)